MDRQFSFNGNPHIGIFATCTEGFVILSADVPKKVTDKLDKALSVVSIKTFIGGGSVTGSLVSGNSSGVVVSPYASVSEINEIKKYTNVSKLPGKMSAAGNLILVNDTAALVHPNLSNEAIRVIEDTLKVGVHKGTIAGLKTVGMAGVATNRGIIVSPKVKEQELKILDSIFGLPVGLGTVNLGGQMIGSGLLANTKGYATGSNTTGHELGRIEEVLGFI